jgi:hypothetical protein
LGRKKNEFVPHRPKSGKWGILISDVQRVEYLIEIRGNDGDKVLTHDICFDILLNNNLSQKLKPIRMIEFNYLIYILTTFIVYAND